MATRERINEWNREDEHGRIQPPLSAEEVDALASADIFPGTEIKFEGYSNVARVALISCEFIRERKPEDTARTLAAYRQI